MPHVYRNTAGEVVNKRTRRDMSKEVKAEENKIQTRPDAFMPIEETLEEVGNETFEKAEDASVEEVKEQETPVEQELAEQKPQKPVRQKRRASNKKEESVEKISEQTVASINNKDESEKESEN